jgi:hypothetical protein
MRFLVAALTAASLVAASHGRAWAGEPEKIEKKEEPGDPFLDRAVTLALAAPAPERDHRWAAIGGVAGVYAAFTVWAYFAWYYQEAHLPAFRVGGDGYFGEGTYAGGADKLGHVWINYTLSRATGQILQWGGWKARSAALLSSGLSMAFWTFVEVKDGFYYEFSPGDEYANIGGALLSALMIAFPRVDELFDYRVEYWPSKEYKTNFTNGDVNIAGDYTGQRYLLALHLGALPGIRSATWSPWARLIDVAIGYETDKYKPVPSPMEPRVRTQHLFFGLSFNAQGAIDLALSGRRHLAARVTHTLGHGLSEVMNVPGGSWAAVGVQRSPDR